MDLKLPEFLTKDYLQNILQKHEKTKNLTVQEFKCTPAVAAGNNYASEILRTNVQYTKDGAIVEKSLIIKTTASDPEMAKSIEDYGIYQREILMYDRILPQFHTLLESVGDKEKLFSPAICVDSEHSTLIFEDLKKAGFGLGNRLTGVDEKHVDLLIRKIAKFHACSMVLYESGKEDFHQFCEAPFSNNETTLQYFNGMLSTFMEQFRKLSGCEKYVEKLENLCKRLPDELMNMYSESKYPIRVLAHGDLWINNMMFKYDDLGEPVELLLIDFQIGYMGAPVNDIVYFTITSASDDIKMNKFPDILAKYHEILVKCLKQLDYKGKLPTLFELYSQYIEKRYFELYSVLTVLPIIINTQEENAELSNLMTDSDEAKQFKKQLFENPKYIKTLKHFLPIWDKMGLLDPLH